MIERRINKFQSPELKQTLKSGLVYAIRGRVRTDEGVDDLVLIEGKPKKDPLAARRSAVEAGKKWLTEIGEIKEFGRHYISISEE